MKNETRIGAFHFTAFVNRAGYEWIRGSELQQNGELSGVGWMLVSKAPIGPAKTFTPLANTGLFREFARLNPTRDGVLNFANAYGHLSERHKLLVQRKQKSTEAMFGEALDAWVDAISDMKSLVALWEAMTQRDLVTLRKWISWRGDAVFFERSDARRK